MTLPRAQIAPVDATTSCRPGLGLYGGGGVVDDVRAPASSSRSSTGNRFGELQQELGVALGLRELIQQYLDGLPPDQPREGLPKAQDDGKLLDCQRDLCPLVWCN